ncbi:hypothetical protein [Natronococcus jeotgali]|uniref:Uncharacterized protein n=1 Tax=Natronococcus jeotgali DSM 18795 TaxID=1227498 RepID=L9WWQ1_9EURY|nr:hypothetical protein [Natronococcus jeotgali]ELY52768.1 hypothetical protein C492_19077 [Natronococcus jeotgali DSM 18795]
MNDEVEFLGEVDSGVYHWDIGQDVHFTLEPKNGKVVLSLVKGVGDTEDLLMSKVKPTDWHKNENLIGKIGNQVSEMHGYGSTWVKKQLRLVKNDLLMADQHEKEQILKGDGIIIQKQTLGAEFRIKGDETVFTVELSSQIPEKNENGEYVLPDGGGVKEIEFTVDQWNGDNPGPLESKYLAKYPKKGSVTITEDAWGELIDEWNEILEEGHVESVTVDEMIAEDVVDRLVEVVEPYVDRKKAANEVNNVLYEYENEKYEQDIVWVQSKAVQNALKDVSDKSESYMSSLSMNLREMGATVDSVQQKSMGGSRGKRVYPFDATILNLNRLDVIQDDEDNEDGVRVDE